MAKDIMITEDYVNFETAKLLKEKGFDKKCRAFYVKSKVCGIELFYPKEPYNYNDDVYPCTSAPTLQMTMKWLREEKHYYIQVMLDSWACGGHSGYYVTIQKTDSDFEMMLSDAVVEVFYQTYEEACESAIKYSLENLV